MAVLRGAPGGRRIFKLAYDSGIPARSQTPGDRWEALSATMGWSGVRVDPEDSAPLPCRSLHFEVEAPDQMVVTKALTRVVRREEGVSHPDGTREQGFHGREVADSNLRAHPTLAHIRQPGIGPAYVMKAAFVLDFAEDSRSSLVLWACLLLTAGLGAGALWPERIHQAEVAATMLVLAPGLLVGAAILPGQHSAVAHLRSGFRVLAGLVSGVSLVAAATLAALPEDASPEESQFIGEIWTALLGVGWLISFLVLLTVRRRPPG